VQIFLCRLGFACTHERLVRGHETLWVKSASFVKSNHGQSNEQDWLAYSIACHSCSVS
jgi:hypothetical protein